MGTLVSRWGDILMNGGLSVLTFLVLALLLPADARPPAAFSSVVAILAILVNFPHFLLSYQLLYWDNRHRLLARPDLIWAAFIAPGLIIGGLIVFIASMNVLALGYLVRLMFFLVGWHYVKQSYGVLIVSSALRRVYFTKLEKRWMLVNLYAVWALGWLTSQTSGRMGDYFGVSYSRFDVPEWIEPVGYVLIAITFAGAAYQLWRKYRRDGSRPPASGWVAVAAIYVWSLPFAYHPAFYLFIPMFHSLQYLPFVYGLRRGKTANDDRGWLWGVGGYFAVAIALGWSAFEGTPATLDDNLRIAFPGSGPFVFLFSAHIFLNIHHYFIDNVLWKNDNPDVSRNLIQFNQVR